MVAQEFPGGDVVHVALRLQFCEDRLLGTAAMMEGCDMASRDRLVGDHDLELVAVVVGDEEVELDGTFGAYRCESAHDEQTKAAVPALGFPTGLEVGNGGVDTPPEAALFNDLLELRTAFEGHRDGEFDATVVKRDDNVVVVEGAVHANLEVYAGQCLPDFLDASQNEIAGAVRIVNVAGAEEEVEDLSGLGDGTEQRVVAALAFLLAVEADGGAFCPAVGAEHRAVEVESEAAQWKSREALQHQTAKQVPQFVDHRLCDLGQDSADRGDMRKTAQLEQAQDERVVVVEAGVSQVSIAEQEMNDEAEHYNGIAVGPGGLELSEALLEAVTEVKAIKKSLEQDQSGEGCELLIFEAELGESVGFTSDLRSAKLHGGDLHGVLIVSWQIDCNPNGSPFYLNSPRAQTSPRVKFRQTSQKRANALPSGLYLRSYGFSNATGGLTSILSFPSFLTSAIMCSRWLRLSTNL